MKDPLINFASENFAGVHHDLMQALIEANQDNTPSYGKDPVTLDTIWRFKQVFGNEIEVYFTFNGTGANNFGLSCMVQRHHAILCTDVSHLYVDESTAPETFTGCRIYPVPSLNGKMTIDGLTNCLRRRGDIHHPQPKVVSLTQPTEYGTVYTIAELRAIRKICTDNDLLLHVDGARFFNAAVFLNASLKEISKEAGIDVLTLGGTKTGMMFGEAVIFFNPPAGNVFNYNLKRSMQLASKNRFIAAQFEKILKHELWYEIAEPANRLASYFAKKITAVTSLRIAHPVETNAVFVHMSPALHQQLQELATFYYWNEEKNEARFIFSFNNTTDEIDRFIEQTRTIDVAKTNSSIPSTDTNQ